MSKEIQVKIKDEKAMLSKGSNNFLMPDGILVKNAGRSIKKIWMLQEPS